MKLVSDPAFAEVQLEASADELAFLATAVVRGEGFFDSAPALGVDGLSGIEVMQSSGPGVRIDLDAPRRVLVISGDATARKVLAENLHGVAIAEDGYHLHIDYFPEHPYLAEGSVPLVVIGPRGGMPTR